jgi:hypothetical protein
MITSPAPPPQRGLFSTLRRWPERHVMRPVSLKVGGVIWPSLPYQLQLVLALGDLQQTRRQNDPSLLCCRAMAA